jgi:transposase
MKTTDTRKLSISAQETIRIKAVAALMSGMTQVAAAKLFGVTRQAVGRWVKTFHQGGEAALKARKEGRPKGSGKLQSRQAAVIVKLMTDKDPRQLKLPFYLWTQDAVRGMIQRRFGIILSRSQIARYLRAWGMTPQKPVRRAYEQDPVAVAKWLTKEYPAIRARARREKAEIYWGDAMGMRSDHQAGTTYAPRGKTPKITATGRRFRCNMISAISNRGKLRFLLFKQEFSAAILLRLLRGLLKDTRRRVFVILDKHPVHRSATVRKWVTANHARIELFLLPSYSPELNPDELVNQDVKTNAVGRKPPHTLSQMVRNVRRHLKHRAADPDQVRRYFHHPSVRYAIS